MVIIYIPPIIDQGIDNEKELDYFSGQYYRMSAQSEISFAKTMKKTYLDLGFCGLEYNIPAELFELTWLKGLALSRFHGMRGSDPDWLKASMIRHGKPNKFKGPELSCLRALPNLEELFIYGGGVEDLSFLSSLPSLKKIYLIKNNITSLASIPYHEGLERLEIEEDQVTNIGESLARLPNLRELSLAKNKITAIAPLKSLKKLQILELDSNQLSDISVVQDLSNLKTLYISGNRITDLTPVFRLPTLERLRAGYNQINHFHDTPRFIFPRLKELSIAGNPIKNLTPEQIKRIEKSIAQNDPVVRDRERDESNRKTSGVLFFIFMTICGSLVGGALLGGGAIGFIMGAICGPMGFLFLAAIFTGDFRKRRRW